MNDKVLTGCAQAAAEIIMHRLRECSKDVNTDDVFWMIFRNIKGAIEDYVTETKGDTNATSE